MSKNVFAFSALVVAFVGSMSTVSGTALAQTALAPAEPEAAGPPQAPALPQRKSYTSWGANLDFGVGRVLSPGETVTMGRARAGVLVIRDPSFYSIGVTYELSQISTATLGVQAEYLHLDSGLWGQVGPLFDVGNRGKFGFMAALGFSLIGVEYQGRDYMDGFSSVLFAKIRIPLGIIGFGLRGR
jgi:hypothetical protein